MNRELILLRHGKSDWSRDLADFDRPLKERGFNESTKIGLWLRENSLVPDSVLSSPAKRAKQTALQVCEAVGFPQENIIWQEDIYMANVRDLINVIGRITPSAHRLMLVGHNPGLEDLLFYLCKAPEILEDKVLPTATLARVLFESEWVKLASQSCQLKEIIRGRKLG